MKKFKAFIMLMCTVSYMAMILVYFFGDNIERMIFSGISAILLYLMQRDIA